MTWLMCFDKKNDGIYPFIHASVSQQFFTTTANWKMMKGERWSMCNTSKILFFPFLPRLGSRIFSDFQKYKHSSALWTLMDDIGNTKKPIEARSWFRSNLRNLWCEVFRHKVSKPLNCNASSVSVPFLDSEGKPLCHCIPITKFDRSPNITDQNSTKS